MLIKELIEQESKWKAFRRGFGQELARRYVPDIDFTNRSAQRTAVVPQTTLTKPTAQVTAQVPVVPITTAQTPVTPKITAQFPVTPTPAAPSQPAAAKPRVLAQPIRVGNKVYRPGDAMHARLSQMMQAQKKT